jgi:hypothetical protein
MLELEKSEVTGHQIRIFKSFYKMKTKLGKKPSLNELEKQYLKRNT